MIVQPARGPHICLRCQRGLAKRSTASASQVAFQSTGSKLREPTLLSARTNRGDGHESGGGSRSKQLERTNRPRTQLHGYRGQKLQEYREELNENSLGDRANVIVLRDSVLSLYESGLDHLRPAKPTHIDILGQLAEERGLVGQAEVDKNIDGFRPVSERQSWEDINELVRELQDGFTSSQLQKYIENFEGRRDPQKPQEEWVTPHKNANILRVTAWLPGVSDIEEYFDNDPLRGYFLESHTIKQRLILRLLTECWTVELPELVDGIGQFEVEVRKEDLELLLMGQPSILAQIRSAHLPQDNENLEAFRLRGVIRVTGPHVKKPFIVQEFEDALKRVRRVTIPLAELVPRGPKKLAHRSVDRWVERNFDDTTLQSLARLTNTSIILQPKKELIISCIDNKQNALVSQVDVARRLLLTSGHVSDRVELQLACDTSSSKKGAFIKTEISDALPWRDRLREWVRWTAPTGKEESKRPNTPVTENVLNAKSSMKKANTKSTAQSTAGAPPTSTCWHDNYFTDTSAVLGKVLHSPLNFPDSPPMPLILGSHNQFHTFSTQVPNLSRVLSKAHVLNEGERTESLVLRFLPNPFSIVSHLRTGKYAQKHPIQSRPIGAEALTAFPAIEMRFAVDRLTKEPKLKDILAVVQESRTDVMLPHNNADVRFQQRTTSRFLRKYSKPVIDFLEKSSLSLKGSVLQTPPSVTFAMEKHLCRGAGFDLLDEVDSRGKKVANENVRDVEYLFAGLEIRRTLAFDYQSWRVLYTSIEAGKAGGRRAELKLRPVHDGAVADEKAFVDMAYELANAVGDRDNSGIVTEVRKVRTSAPGIVRQVPSGTKSEGPESADYGFKYFYRRLNLSQNNRGKQPNWEESEALADEGEAEAEKEDAVETSEGEDSVTESDGTGDKQVPEEGTREDEEDDLKKIEDDRY